MALVSPVYPDLRLDTVDCAMQISDKWQLLQLSHSWIQAMMYIHKVAIQKDCSDFELQQIYLKLQYVCL